jgi:hypothetical protein
VTRSSDQAADLQPLLESLGSDLVQVVTAPRDESEHSAIAPGVVVLAVAVRPGTPEAAKLLLDAERGEASAVVFKRGTDSAGLSQVEVSAPCAAGRHSHLAALQAIYRRS